MRNNLYKVIILIALLTCNCCTTSTMHPRLSDIPIEDFQAADIVFRLGRTVESNLIASSGDGLKSYSHVGVIVNHNDSLKVIHIEPNPNDEFDIIKQESLHDFFSVDKSLSGCVMRMRDISVKKCNTVQDNALRLFNSRITFDHEYILSDSSSMYCTELVEYVFKSVDISLSHGATHKLPFVQESIILPSDIAQNPALITIWDY